MNKIFQGDCKQELRLLADKSVHCCVTSPPYFGLRDYGHGNQIGLEETPEQYVTNLVEVFREVKRVLRDDGTLWLNLGDTYNGQKKGNTEVNKNKAAVTDSFENKLWSGAKPKDLIGIPWMVAFALRADGWYLRQDIIWHKPNPIPESVTDRCTKSHEYIFLLSKSSRYYYDNEAIKQPIAESLISRLAQDIDKQNGSDRVPGKTNGRMKAVGGKQFNKTMGGGGTSFVGHSGNYKANGEPISDGFANKRSVWTVTTKPYTGAHFATYPEELIVDCIKAGCPEGGIVLDPFMGAGTTAIVARKLLRNYIGVELNEEYIRIAQNRIRDELGLFA